MALTTSATPSISIGYTTTDTSTLSSITESSTVGYQNFSFTNGTGLGNVNAGVTITGALPAGGEVEIDFSGVKKAIFGSTITLNFSRKNTSTFPGGTGPSVKGILLTNTYLGADGTGIGYLNANNIPYFNVVATGSAGFTGLFGGSGDFSVYPYSTWAYTNYRGTKPIADTSILPNAHKIWLKDSGSGVPFELSIVGITGGQQV